MTERILVVLNETEASEGIVPWAQRLAVRSRAELHLLVVCRPVRSVVAGSRVVAFRDQVEEAVRGDTMARLRGISRRLDAEGLAVAHAVRFGDPVSEILAAATELGADLVALAWLRTGGLRSVFKVEVAAEVIRRAAVPVLVLRPDTARVA